MSYREMVVQQFAKILSYRFSERELYYVLSKKISLGTLSIFLRQNE